MDKEKERQEQALEPFPKAHHLSHKHHSTLLDPLEDQDPKCTAINRKQLSKRKRANSKENNKKGFFFKKMTYGYIFKLQLTMPITCIIQNFRFK